jgi:glycerol-3-phosphate dehydrogenase
MRPLLASLDGQAFDVGVIGGGINGTAAAQRLAAAGYRVVLFDKGDFGSGASGRSSRMLHCGLRYLAPGTSLADLLRQPKRALAGIARAREALAARADFVATTPHRTRAFTCFMPIYRDGAYPGWQVDLAFLALGLMNPGSRVGLDYRRIGAAEAGRNPLLRFLRNAEQLASVARFREYLFDWPERICVDAALAAERMGAVIRNYASVTDLTRRNDSTWGLTVRDELQPQQTARVGARIVLNLSGVWIDAVNRAANSIPAPPQKVMAMKGTHILVRLPPGCADAGLIMTDRMGAPFFCVPAPGGLHAIGLTDRRHDTEPDDVRPAEPEILAMLEEARHQLPGLGLRRTDIIAAWSGLCPYTFSPAAPIGKRTRDTHDLAADGLPGVLAVTGGSLRTHRMVAAELEAEIRRRFPPSRPPRRDGYRETSDTLRDAITIEHSVTLVDLLFRRLDRGWSALEQPDQADATAATAAEILDWDATRRANEAENYRATLRDQFAVHTRPAAFPNFPGGSADHETA